MKITRKWGIVGISITLMSVLCVLSCHKKDKSSTTVTTPTLAPQRVAPGDAVIYEMFIHDCSTPGTFQGAILQLPRLKAMGINMIWLMPVYPIGVLKHLGTYGSPYSVMNYEGINTTYGAFSDFQAFVDSAHAHGMAVMLDWVAHHTSWDNPWITEYPSWYRHNAQGQIIPPPNTNYTDVAALDYSNNAMRTAMIQSMAYWVVNYDIDGFRCDDADSVPGSFWTRAIDTLRQLHSLVMLAESGSSTQYNNGFDMVYGWNFYSNLASVYGGTSVSAITTAFNKDNSSTSNGGYIMHFTTDHDYDATSTPVQVFGSISAAESASVITIFMNPVQMLYNSQEVGSSSPIDIFEKVPIAWTLNPSVQAFYNKAYGLYNSQLLLHYGTTGTVSAGNNVCMYTKSTSTQEALIAVNVRATAQTVTLPAGFANTKLTDQFTGRIVNSDTLQLAPYGYVVLE